MGCLGFYMCFVRGLIMEPTYLMNNNFSAIQSFFCLHLYSMSMTTLSYFAQLYIRINWSDWEHISEVQ